MDKISIYRQSAEVLGRHALDVIARMSSLEGSLGGLWREDGLKARRYVEAVRVNFQGTVAAKPVKGFFICAFHVFQVAQELAQAIALKMGLSREMAQDREGVENVLGELLNIIIGLTCPDWAKIGLEIDFDPPEKLGGHHIEPMAEGARAYHLSINLPESREISIFVNFIAPVVNVCP
ncbi:MAG: chemotaxis protein CheX [Deltaproteobacteria bacterium]|jgi:CheY-specific phosphatase CheX|nr:chemotaxis protein CheX [Deltaproteobacteria bacterium]